MLTDNAKTVTVTHIAGVPVRHPLMVDLGRHYGTTVHTCVPYDPQSKGGVRPVRVAMTTCCRRRPTSATNTARWTNSPRRAAGSWPRSTPGCTRPPAAAPTRPSSSSVGSCNSVPMEPHTAALGQARIVAPDQTVSFGSVCGTRCRRSAAGRARVVAVQGDEVVIRADARRLPVVPDWAAGQGLVEVARHRTSTPGNPRINLSHYPDHPQNPDGSPAVPRPRAGSLLEQ